MIVLSGGICWAVATLMHPETIERTFVEITLEDVQRFKTKATNDYESLKDARQGLYLLNTQSSKDKFTLEVKRVAKTFDQLEMIAGASLLETLMLEFNISQTRKRYYLSRDGYIGWITGYIIRKEIP